MRCSVTRPSFRCATRCLIFAGGMAGRRVGRDVLLPFLPITLSCPPNPGRRRLIDPHAEAQAHRVQDLLDLVQALAAEVLRLEHLGLGLLHQLANRADVRVLEAVVRTHRQLELLDALVEVFVADAGARLIGGGFGLLLGALFEVDEDVQVIANQLGGERHGVARGDRSVRPDVDGELVVVGRLSEARRFDEVVHLLDRRVRPSRSESSRCRDLRRSSCRPTRSRGRASCASPCGACRPRRRSRCARPARGSRRRRRPGCRARAPRLPSRCAASASSCGRRAASAESASG